MIRFIDALGWAPEVLFVPLLATLLFSKKNVLANRLLALAITCALFKQIVTKMKIWGTIDLHPYLFRSTFITELLAIPVLLLYVEALTIPGFRLRRHHRWHLLVPLFGVVWYLSFLALAPGAFFELGPTYFWENSIRMGVKILIAIPYLILIQKRLTTFETFARAQLSDVSMLRVGWLRFFMTIVLSIVALDVATALSGPYFMVWKLRPVISLCASIALLYFSLRYSTIFAGEIESRTDTEKSAAPSSLSIEELSRQKQKLLALLEENEIYLNPELRLSDIAESLGIKPYRVSEIINRGFNTNFYDLINRYRVARAEQLLKSPQGDKLNLLGIAMDSGFKSKSVFNEVFKKNTGKTPSEFRLN